VQFLTCRIITKHTNWMATSETDIKHKLLSVREKLDIMHNVEITSKAYHKKITEKLGISLPTSNMRHNTHTVLK